MEGWRPSFPKKIYNPRMRECLNRDTDPLKVPMTRNFLLSCLKELEDEEWRLFYSDSTLGCRVIQDFDLCKLDMCDVTKGTQSGEKSQKIEYLCKYSIYRVEILQG